MARKTTLINISKIIIEIAYKNIRKISSNQGDDCINDCLLCYLFFNEHYKLISIDLTEPEVLDIDPKARTLLDYTNFFPPHDYKSNDEAIYKPL